MHPELEGSLMTPEPGRLSGRGLGALSRKHDFSVLYRRRQKVGGGLSSNPKALRRRKQASIVPGHIPTCWGLLSESTVYVENTDWGPLKSKVVFKPAPDSIGEQYFSQSPQTQVLRLAGPLIPKNDLQTSPCFGKVFLPEPGKAHSSKTPDPKP